MAFDPDAYLADKQPAAFDPDAYLAGKASKPAAAAADSTANEVENPHDPIPYIKNTVAPAIGHAVMHPIDTITDIAKGIAADPVGAAEGILNPVHQIKRSMIQKYKESVDAGNSHDDAVKDALNLGLTQAAGASAGEGLKVVAGPVAKAAGWVAKKGAKAATGVAEGSIDRYVANPSAVNGAADLPAKVKDFLTDADARAAQGSADSGAAFNTLNGSGGTPLAHFTEPLDEAVDHIKNYGVDSQKQVAAQRWLSKQASSLEKYADENGNIPLDKGKSLIGVLRAEMDSLEGKVDTQTLKAYGNAIKDIDSHLKAQSPEYAAQMSDLEANTKAATGLTDRFRTDTGALNTLKRIQRGKDPFASDAMAGYDSQFGTTHGEDLQNSLAKSDFSGSSTNGSRKAVTGAAIGGAIGHSISPELGYMGAAAGSVIGSLADVYGKQAVKAALDAGINLKSLTNTPFIKPIMEAVSRGPQAAAVTHNLMTKNFPAYKATQDDQP